MTLQEYKIEADQLLTQITRLKEKLRVHNERFCRQCEEEFEQKWGVKRGDQIMLCGQTSIDTILYPIGTEYTIRAVFGGIVIHSNAKTPYICLRKAYSPWYYKNGYNGRYSKRYISIAEITDVIKMPDKA